MRQGDALDDGVAALGLHLDGSALRLLRAYLVLLEKWNRTHNLSAIRDPAQMVTHHLLDSLAVLSHVLPANLGSATEDGRLLDIGSGGGLPGIPLAIARPGWKVTVLDSNHKKAAFLRQAVIELPLPNVEVVAIRVEDFAADGRFDVVISRAFSDLATFAAAGLRLLAPEGRLVAMKGVYPNEEIDLLPPGVAINAIPKLQVPGLEAVRHLVVMQRTAP
jgi:16S rRNA (guanine527-N7)-methyltransferase